MVPDEELDFEFHLKRQYIDQDSDERKIQNVLLVFSLTAQQAVSDEMLEALWLASRVKKNRSSYFLRFGVARRLRMIWASYIEFTRIATIGRTAPLSTTESGQLERDLNTIYINTVGTLDNFAWTLKSEIAGNGTQNLSPLEITLTSTKFLQDQALGELTQRLQGYQEWMRDIKNRRNPSAHRIPLTIPPAIVSEDKAREYSTIQCQIEAALMDGNFNLVERLQNEQDRLGWFHPVFLHDPDEPMTDIFPTAPNDLANLIKVCRIVRGFINEKIIDDPY